MSADPARSVTRQDGYTVTLALVPLAEIGEAAAPGAIGGVGYRLEVAGPVAVRIALETFRLYQPGLASHETIDRFAFRRETGHLADAPFGRVAGAIVVPAEARAGEEVRRLAATETADDVFITSPSVWLRLEAGPDGRLRGVPAQPTLGLPPTAEPSAPATTGPAAIPPTATRPALPAGAVGTRPKGTSFPTPPAPVPQGPPSVNVGRSAQLVTPTLWPGRSRPLTGDEAVWRATALLPPAIYARATVGVARATDGAWQVRFSGLQTTAEELRWPDLAVGRNLPHSTLGLGAVVVTVDAAGWQPRGAEAFVDPAAAPELPQVPVSWALPPGRAVALVPSGSWVRGVALLGGSPVSWVRPLGREELRALGFTVVDSVAEFKRAAAGASVLWVQRDALPLVDRAWLRERFEKAVMIGVLDGTIVDLGDLLGTTFGGNGWLPPGDWRPIASSAYQEHCGAINRGGQNSEWLYTAWIVGVSQRVAATNCG
jgi:hypothetical protein